MTCAFAVRGALNKLSGVESVDVSLNKGLATVKLKAGNTLKPEELWQTVRKNGFTPKETSVVVRGEVQGGKLKVSGSNQLFDLAPDPKNPKALEEVRGQTSKTVAIQGSLTPQNNSKPPVPLQVRGIEKGR
jgi:copper chaperone CopZ